MSKSVSDINKGVKGYLHCGSNTGGLAQRRQICATVVKVPSVYDKAAKSLDSAGGFGWSHNECGCATFLQQFATLNNKHEFYHLFFYYYFITV